MALLKSIADLEKVGGIVSEQPILKSISWVQVNPDTYEETPHEADVLLIKPNSGLFADIYKTLDGDADEIATWISKSMVVEDEKGKQKLIGFDYARRLDVPLRAAIWKEIKLLIGLEKKSSAKSTNSSASSSPAESAAEPSPKLESDLAPTNS